MSDSTLIYQKDNNIIGYKAEKLIKIFDVDRDTDVSYLIKTILEILNRWCKIEIHVIDRNGEMKKKCQDTKRKS